VPAPVLTKYFSTYKTNAQGNIFLTGIINVQDFSQINFEIVQVPVVSVSMTVSCMIGVLSGTTLAQNLATFPLNQAAQIHTFNVVGPEFTIDLIGGPPNTNVPIQAWVFLR
jgi:hypothetical protein